MKRPYGCDVKLFKKNNVKSLGKQVTGGVLQIITISGNVREFRMQKFRIIERGETPALKAVGGEFKMGWWNLGFVAPRFRCVPLALTPVIFRAYSRGKPPPASFFTACNVERNEVESKHPAFSGFYLLRRFF